MSFLTVVVLRSSESATVPTTVVVIMQQALNKHGAVDPAVVDAEPECGANDTLYLEGVLCTRRAVEVRFI